MIDASLGIEDNIKSLKRLSVYHPQMYQLKLNCTVGNIKEDEGDIEGGSDEIMFTQPDDAERFVEETNVDSLAIAIGTAHGLYPEGFEPKLRLDLLSEIKERISIPLVLHGGSSNPDDEIAEAVRRGINKINISSDIKSAFYKECRKVLENEQLREPKVIYPRCIENERRRHKIQLFNSNDKGNNTNNEYMEI